MKNKGFTLVELLAVIVVLSIIALIGYSTIGDAISSSKESSNKLTIKNYAEAIDQAIFLSMMNNKEIDLTSSKWLEENVKFAKSTVICDNIQYNKKTSLYGCSVNDSEEMYCYSDNTAAKCTSGKNLFNYDKEDVPFAVKKENGQIKKNVNTIVGFNTYTTLENYIGETVTISFDLTTSESGEFLIYQYQQNGIGIQFTTFSQSMEENVSQRISVTGTVAVLGKDELYSKGTLVIYKASYKGSYTIENIQFELGDTATDYEPYEYVNI